MPAEESAVTRRLAWEPVRSLIVSGSEGSGPLVEDADIASGDTLG